MLAQNITNDTQENCGETRSEIFKDLSQDKLVGSFCDSSKHNSTDFSGSKNTDGSLDNLKSFLNSLDANNTSQCLDC